MSIPIVEENIVISKFSIVKNSKEEEENFIKEVSYVIKDIDVSDLSDSNKLEDTTNSLASSLENAWRMNSKQVNIMRHCKSWWNEECSLALSNYRSTRSLDNWKIFKSKVKLSKQSFFDLKIQKIANKKRGPWELMNWVNKRKLPTIKAIKHNSQQCHDIDNLWNALHSTFNTALHHQVDVDVLDEIINKLTSSWPPFSKEEFKITIANCNNASTPGLDKLLWSHLKIILKDDECLNSIICIANACIELEYWPSYFKRSTTVIIPKPNKKSYDTSKSFRPIILLNIMSKLIKKIIGERLQFIMLANNFIHPSQLGGLKFKFTTDVGVALIHIIRRVESRT